MKIVYAKADIKEIVKLISGRFRLFGKIGEFSGFPLENDDFEQILLEVLNGESAFEIEDKMSEIYNELKRLR